MAYVKAAIGALLAALLLALGAGVGEVFAGALVRVRPEDRAVVYADGVSAAMNSAAFLVLLLVPLAVIAVFVVRRRTSRSAQT